MVNKNPPSPPLAAAAATKASGPARGGKIEKEIVFDVPKSEMKILFLKQVDPNVWNSRLEIDERSASFLELQSSINADGLHEPLVVTPKKKADGSYHENAFDLVAGHRRYRALVRNNHQKTWCNIKYFTHDVQIILTNIQENIIREPLRPFEVAAACKKLRDMNYSVKQIAIWVHKSEGYVGRLVQLTEKLIPSLLEVFARNDSEATVKQLFEISHKPPEEQKKHAEAIKEGRDLRTSMADSEAHVEREPREKDARPKIRNRDAVRNLLGDLRSAQAVVVKGRSVAVENMSRKEFVESAESMLRWVLREVDKYPLIMPKEESVEEESVE